MAQMLEQGEHQLSKVQTHVLEILRVLIDILEESDITYYMQGGTMLGAVRHKGFIPWDDDVDLAIPRNEYDLFFKRIKKKLPKDLELRVYLDKTSHHYYFARIVNPNFAVKRLGSTEEREEEIWIDIFPLDGMPHNAFRQFLHKARLTFCRMMYHIANIEKVNIKRPGRKFIEKFIINLALATKNNRFLISKRWLHRMDKLLKKYPVENSDYLLNFSGQTSYKFNEMIPKSFYGKGAFYDFEDLKLRGPENYDAYLKSLYGNYMEPPKDKNAHLTEFIEKAQNDN